MSAELRQESEGHLRISGELTFATVTATLKRSEPLLTAGSGPLVIDLGGITRTDSAGLALLVEWLRRSRSAGRPLSYANLPDQLTRLARVSDMDDLLPVEGRSTGAAA